MIDEGGHCTTKKFPVWHILLAAVIYFILCLLGSTPGLLGPACFAYVGTVLAFFFSFHILIAAVF